MHPNVVVVSRPKAIWPLSQDDLRTVGTGAWSGGGGMIPSDFDKNRSNPCSIKRPSITACPLRLSGLPVVMDLNIGGGHGLRTPREEIAFTARPKIQSKSQIFRYCGSISCLPHRPNFSDIFDLCLHWVSVVRGAYSNHSIKHTGHLST